MKLFGEIKMENQKNTYLERNPIAGIASILIGILNIVLVIYIVAATGGQRYDAALFFVEFVDNSLSLSMAWIVFSLTGMLALFVVPAIKKLTEGVNDQLASPISLLGIICFTVLGLWAVTLLGRIPTLAENFVNGSVELQESIIAQGLPEIDPYGWYSFFGIGTWLIVINVIALKGKRLPRGHAIVGILLGLSHYSTFIGGIIENEPLNLIASAGGALFYPTYFIWLGVLLLRDK